MATPNFNFQFDPAIAQLALQKRQQALQEQQLAEQNKQQRAAQFMQAIELGSQMTAQMAAQARDRQQIAARNSMAELLASGSDLVPGSETTAAQVLSPPPTGQEGPAELIQTQSPVQVPRSETPEFQSQLQAQAIRSGIGDSALGKRIFEKPEAEDSLARTQKLLQIRKLQKGFQTEGAAVDAAKKVLIDAGMPEEELQGLALDDIAQLSNNTYKIKIANAREKMADVMKNRLQESVSKTNMNTAIKVGNRINPGASNDVTIRRERVRLGNAAQLAVLAQAFKGEATKQEIREASTALAGLVMGGSSSGRIAKEQIDELTPSSLRGNIENQIQWLTNQPRSAKMNAFLNRMVKTSIREAREAEQNIRKAQVGLLKGAESLKTRSPQAYQAVIDASGGLDPKKIKGADYIIDKDYNSILPLFDPFRLTAEGVISGNQPLTVDLNEARKLSNLPFDEKLSPTAPAISAKDLLKGGVENAQKLIENMSLEELEIAERELLGAEDSGN